MLPITMRKITRQCFVPGCQNRDSYIFTRNREYRATVILCRECVKEIYGLAFPAEDEPEEQSAPEKTTPKSEEPKVEPKKAPAKKTPAKK